MSTECLVCFSVAGTIERVHDSVLIKMICAALDEKGVEHKFADTQIGWGCLNQDWLEFYAQVETSYDWCQVTELCCPVPKAFENFFSDDENLWDIIYSALANGRLLMTIHYVSDKSLVPHH